MIIYTFSTHFLLQPSQNQLPNTFFCEKYQDFSFFDPSNAKNHDFQRKKGLSNLIQTSIINKTW